MEKYSNENDLKIFIPELQFSTDNAAMIGIVGYLKYKYSLKSNLKSTPSPRLIILMDLFFSNYKANDKYVVMNEIDSKHISRSFRKNIGDSIMITNGFGYLCNAEIVEIGKKIKVKINSIEKFKSSSNSIHIAISPLKNVSRFEWFVEKSTELGISQITPLVCEYSEKKKVNMDRLERDFNKFLKTI